MNQEKIGKFIKEKRKEKGFTQEELGEKLGVSEKTVGNWENGRNMPDVSLFEPLCKELDISVNELIRGEKISDNEIKSKTEENIIDTFKYTNSIKEKENKKRYIIMMTAFFLLSIVFTIIDGSRELLSFISITCVLISLINFYRLIKKKSYIKKVIYNFLYFIILISILIFIDFLCVNLTKRIPKYYFNEEHFEKFDLYHGLFYDVYKIKTDYYGEYTIIDSNNKYTKGNILISPFNRDKVGIEKLLKYKSKELIKDNIIELYDLLPFNELETKIDIKQNNELVINYNANYIDNNKNITIHDSFLNKDILIDDDKYIYRIDSYYLELSLMYNTAVSFCLFDDLSKITFNFNDISFTIDRSTLEKDYNEYKYLIRDDRLDYYFTDFVEKKMNDYNYIEDNFKELFIDSRLKGVKKIEVIGTSPEIEYKDGEVVEDFTYVTKKIIEDENVISSLINLINNASFLPKDTAVTLEGSNCKIKLLDENNEEIITFLVFRTGHFGIKGKHYYSNEKENNSLFLIIE